MHSASNYGGLIMAIVRVSIVLDINTEDTDLEDLRDDLLKTVVKNVKSNPDLFLLKPLDLDDESDWEDFNEHESDVEV
jgi:hypothetical protein